MKHNKPLKLVHLTTSLKIGGAETLLVDLVDQLRNYNFEQKVISFYEGPHAERIRQLGVEVYHVKGLFCRYDPLFFLRLFIILARLKPDCLHSLLWSANFIGRLIAHLLGIPIVCALHNNNDQNGKFRTCLDRLTVSSSDRFVAVSEEVKNSALRYIPSIRSSSVKIITNGIDALGCRDKAVQLKISRPALKLSSHHFVVGSVGRLVSLKNYSLLIDQLTSVVEHYSHVRFVLVGTGPEEEILREKIRQNNLNNNVIMIINQPALPYYLLFDCFILPSYKEGISMALLEAMSIGLPCIVGNHSPEHSVIKSGRNGLVVTPDGSFAEALISVIREEKLRLLLSKGAKETVEGRFSFNNMVKAYASVFSGLSNRI